MANSEEEKVIESFGALQSSIDVRDYTIDVPKGYEFPKEFELKMVRVKNQGIVGSCVAHAVSEVIEYHNQRQEGNDNEMSVGFIYGNRVDIAYKEAGMYIRDALSIARKSGDVYFNDFPYNREIPHIMDMVNDNYANLCEKAYPNRISAYVKLSSADEIKYALMNYGPVVFSITWYKGIKVDNQGVMQWTKGTDQPDCGHCMVIYGWDERGWKIQNSWGIIWGIGGTAILPFDKKIKEAWGIIDEIQGEKAKEDINKPFNSKFKQKIAIIINTVLNIFRKKAGSTRV